MSLKEKIALWFAMREIEKQVAGWLERAIGRPLSRKEKSVMATFLANWKTSLIGVVMGAIQLHQGGLSWQNAAFAALMAALGLAAKDSNVTGGTKIQG